MTRSDVSHPLDDPEPNAAFEMHHQSVCRTLRKREGGFTLSALFLSFQLLLEQQDSTLTDIASTVGLLREQAKVIGQEVSEQTLFLTDLDSQVDMTSSRLAKAQRKMDKFMRDNSSTHAIHSSHKRFIV